jgi:hypothetical protein
LDLVGVDEENVLIMLFLMMDVPFLLAKLSLPMVKLVLKAAMTKCPA